MCIRQHSAPLSATSPAIAGSALNALTSFTKLAPAPSAASATGALDVSIEICGRVGFDSSTPVCATAASLSITGITLRNSSATETGSAPGRVDSPPMSKMSAPSATSCSARVKKASRS